MSLTMYQASVPVVSAALRNLRVVLEKAQAHVEERKLDPNALLAFRLYPDMFPLTRQVQIACDMAKGCAARLAAIDPPSHADTETTFAELFARIEKTLAFIGSLDAAQFEGAETRPVVIRVRSGQVDYTGESYLLQFVLPNLFFHVTTVYNILRHNGVGLGKLDYLGQQAAPK